MTNTIACTSSSKVRCGLSTQKAVDPIDGRWKMILSQLLFSNRPMRLSESKRAMSGVSQKMLIQQLHALEPVFASR